MSQNKNINQSMAMANMVGQIGCVTGLASLIIIALAFGAGRLLDSWFGLNGLFTIIFMLGSFPITLFAITKISMSMVARLQGQVAKLDETKNLNEEES